MCVEGMCCVGDRGTSRWRVQRREELGRAQGRMMGQDMGRMTDVFRGKKEEVAAETQSASHSSDLNRR